MDGRMDRCFDDIPSIVSGRHTVDVSFAGQQIQGSPFYIEVFDINKIRVDHFYSGSVGDPAGFSGKYSLPWLVLLKFKL